VFFVENGVADFEMRRVPLRTWQANLTPEPVVEIDQAVLDAANEEVH